MIEVEIPFDLYDMVCSVCDDPDDFCINAIKKFTDVFLDG
jgi:hypothetical protein